MENNNWASQQNSNVVVTKLYGNLGRSVICSGDVYFPILLWNDTIFVYGSKKRCIYIIIIVIIFFSTRKKKGKMIFPDYELVLFQ